MPIQRTKMRIGVLMPVELINRLNNTAAAYDKLTASSLIRKGALKELQEYESRRVSIPMLDGSAYVKEAGEPFPSDMQIKKFMASNK